MSDLRALAQLATDATTGVTRITEEFHQSIWSTLGFGGGAPGRTRGITGLVYGAIYSSARLVGKGVDGALAGAEGFFPSAEGQQPSTPRREAILAALNGVIGDRLAADHNPLAIPMTLRFRGQALRNQDLSQAPEPSSKVLVLIHGLCLNDLQRYGEQTGTSQLADEGSDHGEALASALGASPVYLRYNSGLHISQNGRELSAHLEELVARWPKPLEELIVVAHSMGGLLIRSAFDFGRREALGWPDLLESIVFLGTPHQGAPLERAGSWLDLILGSTPYSAPFARLGKLRSAGITDLRYGHVLDEDWQGRDRFHPAAGSAPALPLPEGVHCYTLAATRASPGSAYPDTLTDRFLGDGLVPLDSALGRHEDSARALAFAPEFQWIAHETGHMELLSSPEVLRQLLRWLD